MVKIFKYENELLTRRQVQALLQVSKKTVLDLIHDGYLPAMIIANSYRIKKTDLIDFIEKTSATYYHR